jgi:O-antigen/teichoic acid export membrane protein
MIDEALKKQYEKEIEHFYVLKRRLLIVGLVLLGVALTDLILMFSLSASSDDSAAPIIIVMIVLLPLFIIGGVIPLIFRGIYDNKIHNRKRIIARSDSEQRELEHPHSKDDKLGF